MFFFRPGPVFRSISVIEIPNIVTLLRLYTENRKVNKKPGPVREKSPCPFRSLCHP